MIKNKLLQLRLESGYKYAKDFAEFLEVPYVSYTQWESNKTQMPLDALIKIYLKIKEKFPEKNLQDLLNLEDEK